MNKVVFTVIACAAIAISASAEAKGHRRPAPVRIEIVDIRATGPCSPEVYPYAPSLCLRGGYIVFDDKAYFAPRYGYRAHRYGDGW